MPDSPAPGTTSGDLEVVEDEFDDLLAFVDTLAVDSDGECTAIDSCGLWQLTGV